MQAPNGNILPIEESEFQRQLREHALTAPVVQVGDVFKIRGCHFVVSEIRANAISAVGIPRQDYYHARRQHSLRKTKP